MSVELEVKPQGARPADNPVQSLPAATERFTLMELWRVTMKRRYIVLAITLLSLGGAVWYALRTPPVFESSSLVEISPQQQPDLGLAQAVGGGGTLKRIP